VRLEELPLGPRVGLPILKKNPCKKKGVSHVPKTPMDTIGDHRESYGIMK
jgi:hypothetical protein